jgi:hypothetical protein
MSLPRGDIPRVGHVNYLGMPTVLGASHGTSAGVTYLANGSRNLYWSYAPRMGGLREKHPIGVLQSQSRSWSADQSWGDATRLGQVTLGDENPGLICEEEALETVLCSSIAKCHKKLAKNLVSSDGIPCSTSPQLSLDST